MQPAVTFLDPESAGYARRKIYRYPLDAPNGDFVQVRLDRDAYVDSRKIVGAELGWQPDCEAREVLARCQHAGFLRCVFRGCTLESFYSSQGPEYISLLVPADIVKDTVEALREVEISGSTQKLAALADQLKVPLDAWLAPGKQIFRRGVDYTVRSSRFLQLLRLLADDYHVRVTGRAEADSVKVEVRSERANERHARLRRMENRRPRWRHCFVCGETYNSSEADSRKQHRKICRELQMALWPRVAPGLARLPRVGGLIKVTGGSPAWLRARFYRWSRLLCRERGYDTVCNVEPTITGLLLADDRGTVRAVAAVRPDGYQGKAPGRCVLAWVWVPPLARRRGALAELWDRIEGHFGPLEVEGPFSPSMWAFLESRGLQKRAYGDYVHEGHQKPEVAAAWAKRGPLGRAR